MGQYFVFTEYHSWALQEISDLQLGYRTRNSLKLLKLFALEAVVDNSQFSSYPIPSTTLRTEYNALYTNQRAFDPVATAANSDGSFPLYLANVCSDSSQGLLRDASNPLYPSNSYSAGECQSVLGGVLTQSLRLGSVGFAETQYNFTKLGGAEQLANSSGLL